MPSPPDDCLFCKLVREGEFVAVGEGLVAIRDLYPQAPVHVLVIPTRHVGSFREISEFSADEDKRLLDFVAQVAREQGLTDYKVQVNVGPSAGQTIFHLHWHILGNPDHVHHETPVEAL